MSLLARHVTLRVAVVTEFCPPYRTGFYELFADRYDAKLFLCNTRESWRAFGDFPHAELAGVDLRDRYRVTPAVFARLRRYDPDVVVGAPVEGFGGQSSYLYARATDTPFVLWTGEWHVPLTTLRTATFPLVRRVYRGADAIAAYGPHVREYLADLGVDESKVHLAWNTVDTAKFASPPADRGAALRDAHGLPADAPVLLYVGRLVKEKGVGYLLDAFERVRGRAERDPHLVVVGDGDRRDALEARAAGVGSVTFAGYVDNDDLPGYYALADAFVLPSVQTAEFREPWGLVVNEAMSAGTPVVATGQVGAAAGGLVSHGENGFVVPERNPAALADPLERLVDDDDLSDRLGERAREDVADYDYERMLSGFTAAFEQLDLV